MRGLVRPLSFLAVSLPLFFAWDAWLRDPYARLVAGTFSVSARLCGRDVRVADVRGGDIRFEYDDVAWSDSFGLTGINTVALAGLVWATGGTTRRRRLRMLAAGLGALFVTQVAGLWTDIAHVHLHQSMPAFANGLRGFMTGFGTFFFPLAIWLWLVRDRLPFAQRTAAAPAVSS